MVNKFLDWDLKKIRCYKLLLEAIVGRIHFLSGPNYRPPDLWRESICFYEYKISDDQAAAKASFIPHITPQTVTCSPTLKPAHLV